MKFLNIAAIMVLIMLPAGLFSLSRTQSRQLREERVINGLMEQMELHHTRLKLFPSFSDQLRTLMLGFCRRGNALAMGSAPEQALIREFRTHIAPLLPPHEAFLFRVRQGEFQVFYRDEKQLHFGPVIDAYLKIIQSGYWHRMHDPTREEDRRLCFELNRLLQKHPAIMLPLGGQRRMIDRVQVLLTRQGRKALAWFKINPTYGIVLYIDVQNLRPEILPKLHIKNWQEPDFGLAFVPATAAPVLASGFFRRHHTLIERWQHHPPRQWPTFRVIRQGSYLIGSVRPDPRHRYRPVVVASLRTLHKSADGKDLLFALLFAGIWMIALQLSVGHVLFNRPVRMSVRTLFLASFLLASLLPLTSAEYLAARQEYQAYQKSMTALEGSLDSDLRAIDEEGGIQIASIAAFIKEIPTLPEVQQGLEERYLPGQDNVRLMRYLIRETQRRIPFRIGRLFIVGPNGTARSFVVDDNYLVRELKENIVLQIIMGYARRHLAMLNPDVTFVSRNAAKRVDPEAVKLEMAQETLVNIFGPRMFYQISAEPDRLLYLENMSERTPMMGRSIPLLGSPLFYEVAFWHDTSLNEGLLEWYLRPPPRGSRHADVTVAATGYRSIKNAFPLSISELTLRYPKLMELLRLSFFNMHALKLKATHLPGEPIFQVQGSTNFKSLLGGRRNTTPITRRLAAERRKLNGFMLLGMLFTGMVALLAAGYFLLPLFQLIRAVRGIDGGDLQIRLSEARGDEFGALNRSYNLLAQNLSEGKILETYVSAGVKAALADTDGQNIAQTGHICTATILFCGLLEAGASPNEQFDHLRAFMTLMAERVEFWGGEIDKVIGEKIMIVFHHEGALCPDEMPFLALALVGDLRSRWSRLTPEIPLYFGLNTGKVISGVLGAPTVRLDHTVIGDPVNLAARLAALAALSGGSRVVISDRTRAALPESVCCTEMAVRTIRGKSQEVGMFLLDG